MDAALLVSEFPQLVHIHGKKRLTIVLEFVGFISRSKTGERYRLVTFVGDARLATPMSQKQYLKIRSGILNQELLKVIHNLEPIAVCSILDFG